MVRVEKVLGECWSADSENKPICHILKFGEYHGAENCHKSFFNFFCVVLCEDENRSSENLKFSTESDSNTINKKIERRNLATVL